jgi:hypothetical protein
MENRLSLSFKNDDDKRNTIERLQYLALYGPKLMRSQYKEMLNRIVGSGGIPRPFGGIAEGFQSTAATTPSYKFYKWVVKNRSGDLIQVGEFQFLTGDTGMQTNFNNTLATSVASTGTTCSAGTNNAGEDPMKLQDGKYSNYDYATSGLTATKTTKWCSMGGANGTYTVVFTFANNMSFDGYDWFSANDTALYPNRQPASWIVYGSTNGNTTIDNSDIELHAGALDTSSVVTNYDSAYRLRYAWGRSRVFTITTVTTNTIYYGTTAIGLQINVLKDGTANGPDKRGFLFTPTSGTQTPIRVEGIGTTGSQYVNISGLVAGTTYKYRPYITFPHPTILNSTRAGIYYSYGQEGTITTKVLPQFAPLTVLSKTDRKITIAVSFSSIPTNSVSLVNKGLIASLSHNVSLDIYTDQLPITWSPSSDNTNLSNYSLTLEGFFDPGSTVYVKAFIQYVNGVRLTQFGPNEAREVLYSDFITVKTKSKPTLDPTITASNISTTSLTINMKLTDLGEDTVTKLGVCWIVGSDRVGYTDPYPDNAGDLYDGKQEVDVNIGSIVANGHSITITGLTPGQTYKFRAYAINSVGTRGNANPIVQTLRNPPTFSGSTSESLNTSSFTFSAVANYTGYTVSQVGVCYNTTGTPAVSTGGIALTGSSRMALSVVPSSSSKFSIPLSALKSDTLYFARAYLIFTDNNTATVTYGPEIQITTAVSSALARLYLFQKIYDIMKTACLPTDIATNTATNTSYANTQAAISNMAADIITLKSNPSTTTTQDNRYNNGIINIINNTKNLQTGQIESYKNLYDGYNALITLNIMTAAIPTEIGNRSADKSAFDSILNVIAPTGTTTAGSYAIPATLTDPRTSEFTSPLITYANSLASICTNNTNTSSGYSALQTFISENAKGPIKVFEDIYDTLPTFMKSAVPYTKILDATGSIPATDFAYSSASSNAPIIAKLAAFRLAYDRIAMGYVSCANATLLAYRQYLKGIDMTTEISAYISKTTTYRAKTTFSLESGDTRDGLITTGRTVMNSFSNRFVSRFKTEYIQWKTRGSIVSLAALPTTIDADAAKTGADVWPTIATYAGYFSTFLNDIQNFTGLRIDRGAAAVDVRAKMRTMVGVGGYTTTNITTFKSSVSSFKNTLALTIPATNSSGLASAKNTTTTVAGKSSGAVIPGTAITASGIANSVILLAIQKVSTT